jgi:hypothetical protein
MRRRQLPQDPTIRRAVTGQSVAVARMPQLEETLASLHDADDPGGSGGA